MTGDDRRTACPVHAVRLTGCPHPNPADEYRAVLRERYGPDAATRASNHRRRGTSREAWAESTLTADDHRAVVDLDLGRAGQYGYRSHTPDSPREEA